MSNRFIFGITQAGQDCPESIFGGRDPRTRSHREKLKSLRAFNPGCVSIDTSFGLQISHVVSVLGGGHKSRQAPGPFSVSDLVRPPTSDKILSPTFPRSTRRVGKPSNGTSPVTLRHFGCTLYPPTQDLVDRITRTMYFTRKICRMPLSRYPHSYKKDVKNSIAFLPTSLFRCFPFS